MSILHPIIVDILNGIPYSVRKETNWHEHRDILHQIDELLIGCSLYYKTEYELQRFSNHISVKEYDNSIIVCPFQKIHYNIQDVDKYQSRIFYFINPDYFDTKFQKSLAKQYNVIYLNTKEKKENLIKKYNEMVLKLVLKENKQKENFRKMLIELEKYNK
jgi:hypothetical protein